MACRASKILAIYCFLIAFSILTTYIVAVSLGHIKPFVPYLSFIGDIPPESTVFTQLFVLVAAALMFVVQIQYVNTSHLVEQKDRSVVDVRVNVASVYFGYGASIGLLILACFQESNAYAVYHFGEFVYFFFSLVYFALQTVISKKRRDIKTRIRIAFLVLMTIFFLVFVVGHWLAVKMFEKPWKERYFWNFEDSGWLPYFISAISEWILIALFQCYLSTYFSDFHYIVLLKTSIIVLTNEPVESHQHNP